MEQFLKFLDRDKVFFLESDIRKIKRKNRRLFAQLRRQNCSGLNYIYDVYIKRVSSQMNFAKEYLKDNFQFDRKAAYVLDDGAKAYPKTVKEAREALTNRIQYQAANIFITEESMAKTLKKVSYFFEDFKKNARSWKPHLNSREKRKCRKDSKSPNFQACKPSKWLSRYLNAFAQSLDSHSSYMDSDAVEEFQMSMRLSLEGIGATLTPSFGYTVVENLVPGGPAFKSGQIKRKDKILAVGQKKNSFVNIFGESIEDVVSIIRGRKGTPVYLKILREGAGKKRRVFTVRLIRDKVRLQSEAASIYYIEKPRKVAVIDAPSFYGSGSYGKSISRDVKRLLREAKKNQARAVVLDLSNNRGGSLEEAVFLSGLFFARGNVVKQSERAREPILFADKDKSLVYKGPLVVLVDRLSASASEIVSGTLQNYKRAVIVGADHTFGKGSVQSVEQLGGLGALKTTVGLYFIPSGQSTQKKGISSDIVFPSIYALDDLGEKNLDYALPSEKIADFRSPEEEVFPDNPADGWTPINRDIIKSLEAASKKRVAKSEKFKKIIQRLKKIKERALKQKSIAIAEILDEKDPGAAADKKEEEEAEAARYNPEKIKERYLARPEVQEAASVAADLSRLLEAPHLLRSAQIRARAEKSSHESKIPKKIAR